MYDYYRAADRQAAMVDPDKGRAVPGATFDAVDAKGVDPQVILGQLIALIRDVPHDLDLMRTVTLYPPPEGAPKSPEEWEALPEDSPYMEGPCIEELPADVRDTLADVSEDRFAELAERWKQEFFPPPDDDYLTTLIAELRDLARRAQVEDQTIYCWMCE
ncbi:hypothetical protein ACFXJ8_23875 [Nonomuraea sp. NPDC059194]|uniref:hypothetical protein n=1 Tax=Nonomuraea sp. NPDC059194 TaxID=3346764 RepID=UPI00367B948D